MELSREQQRIAKRIVRIGNKRGESREEILAALSTGLVESNLRNLKYGDADSQGWRQERASLYRNPTNVKASVNRFYDETSAVEGKYGSPGDLAAAVQRPAEQFRGRYADRMGDAKQILATLGKGSGGTLNKGGGKSRYGAPSFQTDPGVDNSGVRQGLMQQYLLDRGSPDALLSLGLSLRDAQDTPATTSLVPGQPRRGQGSSPARGSGKRVDVNELFYDPLGWYLDEGKQQAGGIGGHGDHLHASANSESDAVRIGKWAERMGLTVREQSHFDPVDPVHTGGSFHYTDRAVDVSGDPKKLRKLARKIKRRAK
jgi:hypothetical protein